MTDYWKNEASREDLLVALEKMQFELTANHEEICKLKEAIRHNERLIEEERLRQIACRNKGEADALKWFIRFYFSEQMERREE